MTQLLFSCDWNGEKNGLKSYQMEEENTWSTFLGKKKRAEYTADGKHAYYVAYNFFIPWSAFLIWKFSVI